MKVEHYFTFLLIGEVIKIQKHLSGGEVYGSPPSRHFLPLSLLLFLSCSCRCLRCCCRCLRCIKSTYLVERWMVAPSLDRWPGRRSLLALPHSMGSSPDPPPRETDGGGGGRGEVKEKTQKGRSREVSGEENTWKIRNKFKGRQER